MRGESEPQAVQISQSQQVDVKVRETRIALEKAQIVRHAGRVLGCEHDIRAVDEQRAEPPVLVGVERHVELARVRFTGSLQDFEWANKRPVLRLDVNDVE